MVPKFCCALTIQVWRCPAGATPSGLHWLLWLPPCADSNVSLPRSETLLTFPLAFFREGNVSVLRNALDFPSSVSEEEDKGITLSRRLISQTHAYLAINTWIGAR